MITKQKYHSYALATHTLAADSQIILAYDGVIRYLQQARQALEDNKIEEKFHALTKASELVCSIQSALNFEVEEEIAWTLYHFYSSIDNRICSLHRSKDLDICGEVIEEMKTVREAWLNIDSKKPAFRSAEANQPATSGSNAPQDGTITLSA